MLDDRNVYLGTQVEPVLTDRYYQGCFGLVAGTDFLLVCEYGSQAENPELVMYKRR